MYTAPRFAVGVSLFVHRVVPNVMLVGKGNNKDEYVPKLPLGLPPQVFIGCCFSGLNTSLCLLKTVLLARMAKRQSCFLSLLCLQFFDFVQ